MATPITMPQLGESVTEGVVARWLKAEGDYVERDEPLLEIITDKVNAEMPSPVSGTLVKILVSEGETVPVGANIAQIEVDSPVPAGVASGGTAIPEGPVRDATQASGPHDHGGAGDTAGERRRYSPLVRRLAQEHQIDLSDVQGTGLAGRVTKNDVLAYIEQRRAEPGARPVAAAPAESPASTLPERAATSAPPSTEAPPQPQPLVPLMGQLAAQALPGGGPDPDEEYLPLTPMRRAIAEHMVRSVHTAPHASLAMEVDMTHLVRWRERAKDAVRVRHGVDITYVAFVVQAVVDALKAFPIMNSTWGEDKIILKKRINIGVAIGMEDALVVPVIHDADEKSIVGLARALADLTARARANKLTVQDMQGGTFTVNNVGTFGAILSAPVINQPQAAILAMNAIVKRPVVLEDDAIAVRSMMNLSMSIDHRIVDGLTAGRFLRQVVDNIRGIDPAKVSG